MMDDPAKILASKDRACIIASAGYGKTELIAKAVATLQNGRQLILTHTHAGVKSLRDKFRKLNISSSLYRIETIAGFALKYSAAYPKISGVKSVKPVEQDEWLGVYEAASRLFSISFIKEVIRVTYKGLFVDEYQDCNLLQHNLIMQLADILPCRIVGDPLQGIFDFEDSPLVNWTKDIFPNFERLPDLSYPWRWDGKNEALGEWLKKVRSSLLYGNPIDLRSGPVEWIKINNSFQSSLSACKSKLKEKEDSIVVIFKWSGQAHYLSRNMKGTFTSMEEIECKDLLKWSKKLELSTGRNRALAVIDFASICMARISSELKTIKQKIVKGEFEISKRMKYKELAQALFDITLSSDIFQILPALSVLETIKGRILFRRELWYDMKKAIKEFCDGEYKSLRDAAWTIRNNGRIWGRKVERRTVSRILLIKGLEFDHAIVMDAHSDKIGAKELYVAMTRGSKSLTILSTSPVIQKTPPFPLK